MKDEVFVEVELNDFVWKFSCVCTLQLNFVWKLYMYTLQYNHVYAQSLHDLCSSLLPRV